MTYIGIITPIAHIIASNEDVYELPLILDVNLNLFLF